MIIYEGHVFHDMTVEEEGNLYLADMLRDGGVIDSDQHEFLVELAADDESTHMEFAEELSRILEAQGLVCEFYGYGQSCVIGHIGSVVKFLDSLEA